MAAVAVEGFADLAEHMRAVAPALADLGYHTADSEWLTVFALDPPHARP